MQQPAPTLIPTCPGCAGSPSRRRFLALAGAGLATLATGAPAATGNYEAMVLSCIDPRFQEPVRQLTHQLGLTGQFSSFVIAGAAIGVVAPAFQAWHQTFWDNLAASVQLHAIRKVMVVNHRDCGAARIAYGAAAVATEEDETATHRQALLEFGRQLRQRHPALGVELGLMGLDGRVRLFA